MNFSTYRRVCYQVYWYAYWGSAGSIAEWDDVLPGLGAYSSILFIRRAVLGQMARQPSFFWFEP